MKKIKWFSEASLNLNSKNWAKKLTEPLFFQRRQENLANILSFEKDRDKLKENILLAISKGENPESEANVFNLTVQISFS